MDGFIISDYLASDDKFTNRRREAFRSDGMKSIEASIDAGLRQAIPGLRTESFGFRVYYTHELDDMARKGDIQRVLGQSGC